MIHRYSTFVKTINLSFDYIVLNAGMFLAWYVVNHTYAFDSQSHYLAIAAAFNLLWFIASNVTGLYKHMLVKNSIITFRSLINPYLLFIGFICFAIIISFGTNVYFI